MKLSVADTRLVSAMQLLGDKTRFTMFKLLKQNNDLCVSELAGELNISVPAVSQHFRIFELVGIVDKKRDGQKVCYMLKSGDKFVDQLSALIS
jgi:ArsR family transcriptional regulator